MSSVMKAGVTLGSVVGLFGILLTLIGWTGDPDKDWIFISVAILIQIVVLVWGLSMTASERGYELVQKAGHVVLRRANLRELGLDVPMGLPE